MSQKKRKATAELVEFPVKYEKTRQILEFVPYKIKSDEAILVRTKKYAGFSEPCFVVCNNNGQITIKQIKEEK